MPAGNRKRKYTLDTNLYVRALRAEAANAELELFHTVAGPFEYLTAVVVQELRVGAVGREAVSRVQAVFAPFERRGRVLTPSYSAWKQSAEVLAALIDRAVVDWRGMSRSFVNDVLLAMTCREAGVVLVTDNTRDFERIARIRAFDFVPPWPLPAA